MDSPSSSAGIMLRAAVIIPAVIAVARHDFFKFRAWRERSRRWRREGRTPVPEYQRDNRLWRWRIGALAVMLLGMAGFMIALFHEDLRAWVIWPLYAVAMAGAAAWNLIGSHVR